MHARRWTPPRCGGGRLWRCCACWSGARGRTASGAWCRWGTWAGVCVWVSVGLLIALCILGWRTEGRTASRARCREAPARSSYQHGPHCQLALACVIRVVRGCFDSHPLYAPTPRWLCNHLASPQHSVGDAPLQPLPPGAVPRGRGVHPVLVSLCGGRRPPAVHPALHHRVRHSGRSDPRVTWGLRCMRHHTCQSV